MLEIGKNGKELTGMLGLRLVQILNRAPTPVGDASRRYRGVARPAGFGYLGFVEDKRRETTIKLTVEVSCAG